MCVTAYAHLIKFPGNNTKLEIDNFMYRGIFREIIFQNLLIYTKNKCVIILQLVTLLIGNNDVCLEMCYLEKPLTILPTFKKNLMESLDYLRDNLPNTLVNIVPLGSKLSIKISIKSLVPLVFQLRREKILDALMCFQG